MINAKLDIGKGFFSRKNKLLLACSGGSDSVCLFHLLRLQGYSFSVAHVNYHLRGIESDTDQQFVMELCDSFDINYYIKSVDLKSENKTSIQAEARKVRYSFFEELMDEHGLDFVLTAHHQGDLVENALFRFVRGTGLRGLQSFSAIKDKIIRPLLKTTKEDIQAFLSIQAFDFRSDVSNESLKYTRNKIRNAILPSLEEDLPNASKRIARTIQLLRADFELIQAFVKPYRDLLNESSVKWKCSEMIFSQAAFWFHLFENISEDQCKQIAKACISIQNGFSIQVDGYVIAIIQGKVQIELKTDLNKKTIKLTELKDSLISLEAGLGLSISLLPRSSIQLNEDVLCISADHLLLPLKIRHPEQGDHFQPFGMKGNKLLSDFYNDLKIPAELKKKEWILVDKKGSILALLPHHISEKFKVSDLTKKVMRLELCKTQV